MSLKEMLEKKAAALRAKKNGKPAPAQVKTASKKTAAKKSTKEKKTSTPRANSKLSQIEAMLKGGSSRASIQKKYGMATLADVSWYISFLKRKGRLPAKFETKD